jgi:hypothetical protein
VLVSFESIYFVVDRDNACFIFALGLHISVSYGYQYQVGGCREVQELWYSWFCWCFRRARVHKAI